MAVGRPGTNLPRSLRSRRGTPGPGRLPSPRGAPGRGSRDRGTVSSFYVLRRGQPGRSERDLSRGRSLRSGRAMPGRSSRPCRRGVTESCGGTENVIYLPGGATRQGFGATAVQRAYVLDPPGSASAGDSPSPRAPPRSVSRDDEPFPPATPGLESARKIKGFRMKRAGSIAIASLRGVSLSCCCRQAGLPRRQAPVRRPRAPSAADSSWFNRALQRLPHPWRGARRAPSRTWLECFRPPEDCSCPLRPSRSSPGLRPSPPPHCLRRAVGVSYAIN